MEIEVIGRKVNLLGDALSASEGRVSFLEMRQRPILRVGDVLETVPGLVATQHSGSGKANQLFLRGFNLDHGTDFATSIDGMPVNLRSHGHGQGYTDLNFIIPEMVQEIMYRKGPYYAEVGDFSGAGSAKFVTRSNAPDSVVQLGAGEFGYARALAMAIERVGWGAIWCLLWSISVMTGPGKILRRMLARQTCSSNTSGRASRARLQSLADGLPKRLERGGSNSCPRGAQWPAQQIRIY